MANRLRTFDWPKTPLGPIDAWPPPLRNAVGLCMNSRFPMMLWWGNDLTYIYNDAYAPMLGKRHPEALGRSGREVWSDVWSVIGPQVDAVMKRGESTWNERVPLLMERNGYPEEAWFTWAYSPILDETGKVGGLFNTCREDTVQVFTEARQAFLSELGDTLHRLDEAAMIWAASAERLGRHLILQAVTFARIDETLDATVIETYWADGRFRTGTPPCSLSACFAPAVWSALRGGKAVRIDDPTQIDPISKADASAPLGAGRPRQHLIVPHWSQGRLVGYVQLRSRQPRLWPDELTTLISQIATRTWEAADRAQTRRALSASEERFTRLFESIDEGFCVIELIFDQQQKPVDYRFIEMNPAFSKHMGLKAAVGQSVLDLGIKLEPEWYERYGQVVVTGEAARFTSEAQDLGRWFEVHASRIGQAEDCRVAVLFNDITAQKHAEQELRTSEERLADVFRQAPSFMCVLHGSEHIFERANDRYYQLVGHRDILGKPVREALPEVSGQGFFELLDAVYRTGKPWTGVDVPAVLQRVPGATPERRYLDLVYLPLRGADGRINGILAQGVDLTDRKLAETAAREAEKRLQLIMGNVKDHAIFTLDLEGHVTAWNIGAKLVFGYEESEILGQSASQLFTPEDRTGNRPQIEMRLAMVKGVADDTRCHIRKDGSRFFASGSLEGLRDEAGQLQGFVKVVRDITERTRLEDQRDALLKAERSARGEAERIGRMKDEFLATLSHELRTPLSAILGWAQILARPEDRDPETVAQGIEVIERNARAQSKLIEDLLDMSRIISGKVRLDVQPVEVRDVIQAAIATVRPSADARGIRLESTLPIEPTVVNGDSNRLQQVLWNLLTNAVKFTPRGGHVQVDLSVIDARIDVRIEDSGDGIAREFLPHVFERFRQADASTTRTHGGLGLGLAIVKALVELHGGNVAATSPGVGQGSTFVVSLPPAAEGLPVLVAPSTQRIEPLPMASARSELRLTGIRVLVVDDEPDARGLIRRMLEQCEAEVEDTESAASALEAVARRIPDALVSDIGMPKKDGYTLIRAIRALPENRGGLIPAIALTAFARSEDRQQALVAGFQMHLRKPIEAAELVAAIKSLVELAQRQR